MTGSVSTISSSPLVGKVSGLSVSKSSGKYYMSTDDKGTGERKTEVSTGEKTLPVSQTKLLTAGEVNDFKKWKMWADYAESDFKAKSQRWGLYATDRFSVQLQNNNYRAITGETLYLLNKVNGDTIWTAVSDNTGKAELWNGFSNATKLNDLVIKINGEATGYPAIGFAQGINRITLNRACTVSNKVEIAFVVDATGSMQDEINYLKAELDDILNNTAKKDASLDLHTAAVFYRDHGDEYLTRIQPFTAGISQTTDFIRNQNANGGGDYPEALKEALTDATEKLTWSADARAKIIFLLMDAPPHDSDKDAMAKLIRNAAAKGIRIVPVACSGTDKATEFIMRSIALATNGTYLFLTDDSGIGNKHIKPTTDEFKVELLNDLMQRIIEQMCYVSACEVKTNVPEPLSSFIDREKVRVYPNPSDGPVTLETKMDLKELFVADFTGKILMRVDAKKVRRKRYNLDLSDFPSATYFIRYVTEDGKAGAEKVVIVR
jgi:hypothetical protein